MGCCGVEHAVSNEGEHQNAHWPDTEISGDAGLDKSYFAVLCKHCCVDPRHFTVVRGRNYISFVVDTILWHWSNWHFILCQHKGLF